MMVSTRGRYALRVIIDLAENAGDGHVPMREVAERQGLSLKYLERILPLLVSEHLVEGIHGKGGGYRLSKDPSKISVGEVLRITEGDIAPVACLENNAVKCEHINDCRTLPVWKGLNDRINEYLDSVSIADLMKDIK
ncbi:MAG: Rrf2 family transcriptional regulator [Clostridiales bacterium]|nr:Rrf2 family transcriptional regulator [Clostridiales bacterium]MBR6487794.1 Rrf2 family transcriptional regulator [Clostridiales bacterium]